MTTELLGNGGDNVDSTAKKFIDLLKEHEYITMQEMESEPEMFTARLIGDKILAGNTSFAELKEPNWLLGDGVNLADFNRLWIFDNFEELEHYLKILINDWVTDRYYLGDYYSENSNTEEELKEYLHDIIFWDESKQVKSGYDPTDKADKAHLYFFKTKEAFNKLVGKENGLCQS